MTWHRGVVELLKKYDSLCRCSLLLAQDTHQNLFAIDWAMHVVGQLAMEVVQKASPSQSSHINSVSTRNTLCDSTSVHVRCCQLLAHAGIGLASFLNKIRQT